MEYEKVYIDIYERYYKKIEHYIKCNFIEHNRIGKDFAPAFIMSDKLYDYNENKKLSTNVNLKKIISIFDNAIGSYKVDKLKNSLEREVLNTFNKIDKNNLPENYDYLKFIEELALYKVLWEISRLLKNNVTFFSLIYELNDYTDFEIKEYNPIKLENTPVYKKVYSLLYPNFETEIENIYIEDINIENKNHSLPFVIALLNELEFFDLPKVKFLSLTKKARLISIIQQLDCNDKNKNRSISGNISALKPTSNENLTKYTSYLHADRVKDLLKQIKDY